MHAPLAVFDAGIGSYAIVALIRQRLPRQDIVYFADRASFPYGGKTPDELLGVMRRTLGFLMRYSPSAIVVASNAPSIMVLDRLRPESPVPVFGVYPPLARAEAASRNRRVGIMGVRSLVESAMLPAFVSAHSRDPSRVALIDASPMVELVESGAFLFDPRRTQAEVDAFMAAVDAAHPGLDVLTLSSTHLPWLKPFFEQARPGRLFLDPAEEIVAGIGPGTVGSGELLGLVTSAEGYGVAEFRAMLDKLGVDIPLQEVAVGEPSSAPLPT